MLVKGILTIYIAASQSYSKICILTQRHSLSYPHSGCMAPNFITQWALISLSTPQWAPSSPSTVQKLFSLTPLTL